MTQRGVLWDWAKVRVWERENVFNSCPTHSHPHPTSCLCPPCHLSCCWQMNRPCSLTSQRFVLLHKISAVTLLSPCIIDGVMKMYSQQICLFFFHRPSNKISDLRSVETSPVKSSTEYQHLIIFSTLRADVSHTSLDAVVFCSPTWNSFLKGYIKVTVPHHNYGVLLLLSTV